MCVFPLGFSHDTQHQCGDSWMEPLGQELSCKPRCPHLFVSPRGVGCPSCHQRQHSAWLGQEIVSKRPSYQDSFSFFMFPDWDWLLFLLHLHLYPVTVNFLSVSRRPLQTCQPKDSLPGCLSFPHLPSTHSLHCFLIVCRFLTNSPPLFHSSSSTHN